MNELISIDEWIEEDVIFETQLTIEEFFQERCLEIINITIDSFQNGFKIIFKMSASHLLIYKQYWDYDNYETKKLNKVDALNIGWTFLDTAKKYKTGKFVKGVLIHTKPGVHGSLLQVLYHLKKAA